MKARAKPQLVLPMPLHAVPKTPEQPRMRRAPSEIPIGGLMDPRFVYVPARETNVSKTFARIRRAQQKGALL